MLSDFPIRKTTLLTFQESTSSRSGVPKNLRIPLFVVEIAYAEGIEELATSSKSTCADVSELVVFHPSETEFHTRLEVCFGMCLQTSELAGLPGTRRCSYSSKETCIPSSFISSTS